MKKIELIVISPGSNYYKQPKGQIGNHPTFTPEQVQCDAGRGLKGDRFYDYKKDFKGQVTFFSKQMYADLKKHLGIEFSPTVFRRNILVNDINPFDLIGKRFRIKNVEFEGICNCAPCAWMDTAIAPGAHAWLKEKNGGGLRAKILSSGVISIGDEITL